MFKYLTPIHANYIMQEIKVSKLYIKICCYSSFFFKRCLYLKIEISCALKAFYIAKFHIDKCTDMEKLYVTTYDCSLSGMK